jgi:putative membrane protein
MVWISLFLLSLGLSALRPNDYFTWFLEVFPAILALAVLGFTYNSFKFTDLVYSAILLHCFILFVGGHYTYAEVPFFDWIKEITNGSRNNYDKLGHFAQGFVPALVIRELLIRKEILKKSNWLSFLVVCVCLAISAAYEWLEWLIGAFSGEEGDAFLGTQGYVWDTQSDMLFATIGAITALICLSKLQDKQILRLKVPTII